MNQNYVSTRAFIGEVPVSEESQNFDVTFNKTERSEKDRDLVVGNTFCIEKSFDSWDGLCKSWAPTDNFRLLEN